MEASRPTGQERRRRYATWLASIALLAGAITGWGCKGSGDASEITGDVNCLPLDPIPSRIWRLSVQQYSNSVRDLLGLATAPDLGTLGGQSTYAFFADETLTVDPQLAYNINRTLQQVLAGVSIPDLTACGASESPSDCAQRFAQSFGVRAFRRPVDASEVQALMTVYGVGSQQDFNTGISLMIQALLQSPSFIFRSEVGAKPNSTGVAQLSPYEVATQLAYTFFDSTPDQPLLDAAANGSLGTAGGVSTQIDRLLQLPAVQSNIDRITLNWFNVNQLYAKQKDISLLGPLNPTNDNLATLTTNLQNELITGTNLFVDDLYWHGSGKVVDLLTSTTMFVNQDLATLYGLPFTGSSPDDYVSVDASAQGRAGMLTQPGLIWALSDVASTSIVHRGIGIHDNVICADPIVFPSNILNDPNIVAALAARPTEIEKSDYRLNENPVCHGCHSNIDPYGRVLEGFDPVGNTRTIADGLPVDSSADFSNAPPLSGTLNGPVELAQAIISDHQFQQCAAQQLSSYAIGRQIHLNATCEIQIVRKQFEGSDGKIATLFRDIATAPFVRARSGGAQ
jgi:hypothetical protein